MGNSKTGMDSGQVTANRGDQPSSSYEHSKVFLKSYSNNKKNETGEKLEL